MPATHLVQESRLTRQQVKSWRKAKHLSANKFAEALGYSRSYIKSIEGGSLSLSPNFTAKFLGLQEQWNGSEPKDVTPRSSLVVSRYKLPAEVTLEARPRRCRKCREWFVFAWANQRTCVGCKHKKPGANKKKR